jgi:hypothetical protein
MRFYLGIIAVLAYSSWRLTAKRVVGRDKLADAPGQA